MRVCIAVLLIALASLCAAEEGDVWQDWYGQLSFRSGFLYDFDTEEFAPYLTIPVIGYRAFALEGGMEFEFEGGPKTALLAVTYDLGDLGSMGVKVPGAKHFGLNVGPFVSREFETGETTAGVLFSIVSVSTDAGNVERQKKRGGEDKLTAVEEEDQEWGSIKAMYR